ncbi:hypothetical protein HUT06_35180 [Actinomadura sp. NAK00032]|uniref:hypothetical protein n=1 Tax=Actinomadura sp. NAK00032 TaxID=2742128 RepID=UPI001592438D|nr:hypothetical protein [Actinomadura sp. NAK00032]QKW38616.1 hypothetical protein HUT06_35180 [Actinomadura sp. NAK00032]
MATAALRDRIPFETSRPWVIGAVLLCAVGTLGAVANSARPRGDVGRAAGFADVLRINPGVVSAEQAAVVAVVTVAGFAAMWWSLRRSWPWLLVAGVVLTLPTEFVYVVARNEMHTGAAWFYYGSVTAGAQLVLLGTLAAGLRLVHIGAPGAGAILIGAGVGAQVFGASTDVWIAHIAILRPGGYPLDFAEAIQILLHLAFLATAIGGALLALGLYYRYDKRSELAAPSDDAEPAMGVRTAIAGSAAVIAFIPAAGMETIKGGFGVAACWLLLGAGLVAAALAGLRAAAGTVVASAVVIGISGPASALIQGRYPSYVGMWFMVAFGVVVGAAAAFPSWRHWAALTGCASCAAVLAVTMLFRPDGITVLMLALLSATVTVAIASLGVWLTQDGLSPAVLGPLMFATVIGACGLLGDWQGTGRRGPNAELFREPGHLWLYTVLLLLAGLAVVALDRWRPRPTED